MDYEDEEYEMMQKEKSDLKFVFRILACQNPECVYYLIPPIQQCRGGHSFCAFCIWKETCPICSQTIIGTKCQALESIVKLLLVPCKNKYVGCDEMYPPGLKLDHEEQCIYNYVKCIHSGCEWRGERVNLWRHLTEVHPESMIQSDNLVIEVPLNITATFIYHKILKYWDHYFGVKVSYDIFNNKLYAGVRQAGGSFVHGITYCFSIESIKAKAKHTYIYERVTYDSQRRFRFIFTSEDCFVITKEFLDEFFPSKPPSIDLHLRIKKLDQKPTQSQLHNQSIMHSMPVTFNDPHDQESPSPENGTSEQSESIKKSRSSSDSEKNEKDNYKPTESNKKSRSSSDSEKKEISKNSFQPTESNKKSRSSSDSEKKEISKPTESNKKSRSSSDSEKKEISKLSFQPTESNKKSRSSSDSEKKEMTTPTESNKKSRSSSDSEKKEMTTPHESNKKSRSSSDSEKKENSKPTEATRKSRPSSDSEKNEKMEDLEKTSDVA